MVIKPTMTYRLKTNLTKYTFLTKTIIIHGLGCFGHIYRQKNQQIIKCSTRIKSTRCQSGWPLFTFNEALEEKIN